MDEVIVQPMGGVVGMGGASHVRSEGRIAMSALSSSDHDKVNALFAHPQAEPGNFYYRITLQGANGSKTVNVPPEAVPPALIEIVKTTVE